MNQPVSEKGYKGLGMEGFTAKWYASLTLRSLDEFKRICCKWREAVLVG